MPVTNGDDTISFTPNLNIDSNLGNDTYLFGRTSGIMRVSEGGASSSLGGSPYPSDPLDVVQFDVDVQPADVVFTRNGADLVVSILGSPAQLKLLGFFVGGARPPTNLPYTVVEEFRFADGTVILGDSLLTLTSADATGYIHGTADNDSLVAVGVGGHTIFGKEGNDTLSGAHPDKDYLYGGAGDDVYQTNASWTSSTSDVIGQGDGTTADAGYDVLEIQGGVTSADITLSRGDGGFAVKVGNRTLVWVNYSGYTNGNSSIEAIRFDNGEVLNIQDIARRLLTLGAGDDEVFGLISDDVISGGAGNDYLHDWEGGNDLFLGGKVKTRSMFLPAEEQIL